MPEPNYFDTPAQSIPLGPTQVAYRRFGSGPDLLLIHGFPLSGFTWRKVLPELARHFTCHVPDLAGMGETQWTDATDFTWHGQARMLQALADHLQLRRYAVMGHDTGGTFARCLALADPRVERLVIINSEMPGHRPPWIPLYQKLMFVPGALVGFGLLLRSRAFIHSSLGFGGCFADMSLADGEFHAHVIAPPLADHRRMQGMQRYLRTLKWDVVDRLATDHALLKMPVRLVWGADDPTFPVALAREMATQMPQCDLVEIAGAKLLVHEEKPQAVLAAVLQFLQVAMRASPAAA